MFKMFKKKSPKSVYCEEILTLDEARKKVDPGSETYYKLSKRMDEAAKSYVELDKGKSDMIKIVLDFSKIGLELFTLYLTREYFYTLLEFDRSETFTTTAGKDFCKNVATRNLLKR